MKYQGIIDRARSPFCDDVDLNNAVECLVNQEVNKAVAAESLRIEKMLASQDIIAIEKVWQNLKQRFTTQGT